MKHWKIALAATLSATFLSNVATAENVAIVGGKAFVKGGEVIENATVLVRGEKIENIGAELAVPDGYRVVDAKGKWVTAGLMASGTSLGLLEVPLSGGIDDSSVSKPKEPYALKALDGFNPNSSLIPITRRGGVTRAAVQMSGTGSHIMGQGGVIRMGDSADIVEKASYLLMDISESGASKNGGSRANLWAEIEKDLKEAEAKTEKKKNEENKNKAKAEAVKKQVLKKLLAREMRLFVKAHREADIRRAIDLKKHHGLDVVLQGATEGWRVAQALAEAEIPVILDAYTNQPFSFEQLGATLDNAARLHGAGVKIALGGAGNHNARLTRQMAGNAVANGLPWDAALDAMTVNPAGIYGLSGNYGKLAAGYDADVVVWSGDPLEVMTVAEHVFIAGKEASLVTRQTRLRDRYKAIVDHPAYRK